MTFEQGQPYPGEKNHFVCNYCGERGEVRTQFDLPSGWWNLGDDTDGPHLCRACFKVALRWVMEKVRDSQVPSSGDVK